MNRRDAVSGLLALAAMTGPLRANAQAAKSDTAFRIVTHPVFFPERREEVEPCYAELRNAERVLGIEIHIVEPANAAIP